MCPKWLVILIFPDTQQALDGMHKALLRQLCYTISGKIFSSNENHKEKLLIKNTPCPPPEPDVNSAVIEYGTLYVTCKSIIQ